MESASLGKRNRSKTGPEAPSSDLMHGRERMEGNLRQILPISTSSLGDSSSSSKSSSISSSTSSFSTSTNTNSTTTASNSSSLSSTMASYVPYSNSHDEFNDFKLNQVNNQIVGGGSSNQDHNHNNNIDRNHNNNINHNNNNNHSNNNANHNSSNNHSNSNNNQSQISNGNNQHHLVHQNHLSHSLNHVNGSGGNVHDINRHLHLHLPQEEWIDLMKSSPNKPSEAASMSSFPIHNQISNINTKSLERKFSLDDASLKSQRNQQISPESMKKKKTNKLNALAKSFGNVTMRRRPTSVNLHHELSQGMIQPDGVPMEFLEEIKSHPKRLPSSDASHMSGDDHSIHSGIVWRKRKSGRWSSCKAALYSESIHFLSSKKNDKPPRVFNLNLGSVRLTDASKDSKHFSIYLLQNVVHCHCSSEKETSEWVSAIHKVCESLVLDAIHNTTSAKSPMRSATPSEDIGENPEVSSLLLIPGNNVCADCGSPGPDWMSVNLGIFVCIHCSGAHRSLGTHISKVRSLKMDTLEMDHIQTMKRIGNIKSNSIFEAKVPSCSNLVKPGPDSELDVRKRWIIAKYDYCVFKDVEIVEKEEKISEATEGADEKHNMETNESTDEHITYAQKLFKGDKSEKEVQTLVFLEEIKEGEKNNIITEQHLSELIEVEQKLRKKQMDFDSQSKSLESLNKRLVDSERQTTILASTIVVLLLLLFYSWS